MPHSTTVERQARRSVKKYARNKSVRSLTKTLIDKAETLISSGQLEPAREAVVAANSALDDAAEKGVIHTNNAARRKARLMKKLNEAQAAALVKEGGASK